MYHQSTDTHHHHHRHAPRATPRHARHPTRSTRLAPSRQTRLLIPYPYTLKTKKRREKAHFLNLPCVSSSSFPRRRAANSSRPTRRRRTRRRHTASSSSPSGRSSSRARTSCPSIDRVVESVETDRRDRPIDRTIQCRRRRDRSIALTSSPTRSIVHSVVRSRHAGERCVEDEIGNRRARCARARRRGRWWNARARDESRAMDFWIFGFWILDFDCPRLARKLIR